MADRIFNRAHSISKPSDDEDLPIYIIDNPSKNFFFPINSEDIKNELSLINKKDWSQITHIWLRRFKKTEYEKGELPLAEFCCGSGVRLITLYPWPSNMKWIHGTDKPSQKLQKVLSKYNAHLFCKNGEWVSLWELDNLKDFYVEYLLYHEIGHHVDWYYTHWSKANKQSREEVADQYAYSKTTQRTMSYKAEQRQENDKNTVES